MKKSKIIVPALGILLLSTAASISGTVAWFTANRTFNFTAGDFAVVNTKNNLQAILDAGVGTQEIIADKQIGLADARYRLTDASFDHTSLTDDIIIPNDEGSQVLRVVAANNAVLGDANSGNNMYREANTFSAFTWNVTFKLTFSASETKKVGLFLNTVNSWTHEKVIYDETHTFDATDAGTYYTDAACTTGEVAKAAGDTIAAGTYYQKVPNDTGKAFRVALVPIFETAAGSSYGLVKVWAPNQESGNCKFIDALAVTSTWASSSAQDDAVALLGVGDVGKLYQRSDTSKYYYCDAAAHVVGPLDNPYAPLQTNVGAAYDTVTTSQTGTASIAADSVASGKVLMAGSGASGIAVPDNDAKSSTTAKSDCANYLGYFAPSAGNTVEMKFKVIVWYEGTDLNITNDDATIYETVTSNFEFGAARLSD